MRPGKQRMGLALGLSTALSGTPATQRSGVEGDPGPRARLAKRRYPSFRSGLRRERPRRLMRRRGLLRLEHHLGRAADELGHVVEPRREGADAGGRGTELDDEVAD